MHARYIVRALRCPTLRPAERLVLADLADYASDTERLAWPSRVTLCTDTGLDPKTVQRALARLITLGYISEVKRAQPGRTRTFRLHPDTWPVPAPREDPSP